MSAQLPSMDPASDPAGDPVDGRTARANARRKKRRARILDAALQTFGAHGYHQTQIKDIIEAAGIARGTFYLYFPSKSAIFLELLDLLLEELRDNITGVETRPGAPPVYDQLLDSIRRMLKTAADNRALSAIILREAVGLDAEVQQKLEQWYDSLHDYIQESLENGQTMGFLRDDLDTDIAATCVLGSIRQVLDRELVDKDASAVDLERLARGILRFNTVGMMRVRG